MPGRRREGAEDWLVEPEDTQSRAVQLARRSYPLLGPRALLRQERLNLYHKSLAEVRVQRGVRQLSKAERVVTDRLHVHIFCTLLGIEHFVIDNKYGKLSEFHKAWMKGGIGTFCHDLQEALELAGEKRKSPPELTA